MNKKRASHQDFLQKKEAKGKWSLYWAVLDGTYLLFYESKKSKKLFGSIQIGSNTRCIVAKRKTYSFPFMVCAAHGRHLFKCESGNRRHQWMTAIQEAVQLLRLSSPPILIETDQKPNDLVTDEASESHSTDENQEHVLPSNVLLVASFPATSDSPSLPFRVQDRWDHSKRDAVKEEQTHAPPKSSVTVYPFARQSEDSPRNISASEREQISTLNLSSHSSLYDRSLLWATDRDDSLFSLRNRSLPSTPEKGSQPSTMSPQTLSASMLGKSKSLNSLPSSDSLSSISSSHMRFSRHMVSGNDVGDMDV